MVWKGPSIFTKKCWLHFRQMIIRATPQLMTDWFQQLVDLLEDSVLNGASVGFLLPLGVGEIDAYWDGVHGDLEHRIVLLVIEDGQLQGSVQLELAKKANGRHRAEVQKLLVHSRARRQGLGRQLMSVAEQEALAAGRTLLVLDTRVGDPASKLYKSMNYQFAGAIPGYVWSDDGQFAGTAIFYKNLP